MTFLNSIYSFINRLVNLFTNYLKDSLSHFDPNMSARCPCFSFIHVVSLLFMHLLLLLGFTDKQRQSFSLLKNY